MANTPGETSIPIGEFSVGSLKVYEDEKISLIKELLDTKIRYEAELNNERDKRYQDRWQAQEVASHRYQKVNNEFQGSLEDLSNRMATKTELTTAVDNLGEKIDLLRQDLTSTNSRLDVGNPDVRTLQNQQSAQTGRTAGSEKTIAYVITAVSVLFGLYGLLN